MKNFVKKTLTGLIVVLVTGICASSASAMGGAYGKGNPEQPTSVSQWPAGVKELVNQANRTGGYWVNGNDWYFFDGDTKDFNTFLAKYSRLQGTPLALVIHAGKAPALPDWTHASPTDHATPTESAWQLSVIDNDWTEQAVHEKPVPRTHYTVTVNLWLTGQVELEGLKVPAGITVKSGGEIETFVTQHRSSI